VREVVDEATGISSKVVIDWKQQPRGNDLKPRITLRDDKQRVLTLANGLEARYFMSVDAILSVENGAEVKAGDVLARIPRESSKTRDITGRSAARRRAVRGAQAQGLRHHQRGRRPRRVRQGLQDQAPHRRDPRPGERQGAGRVPDPKGKHISVQEGDYVLKGDLLMDGNPVPHDILRVLASRRSPHISSTRSRRSIASRACASTTSTSR